ncbi:hypothetical protein MIR68_008085 [Amoeboaphelidium protococcarum]|nr:hypothetical protein MIR68_008085 [Amoeboaphelidium protococcarum]
MKLTGQWKRLCSVEELRLDLTCVTGQSFRWNKSSSRTFTTDISGRIFTLYQNMQSEDKSVYYWHHTSTLSANNNTQLKSVVSSNEYILRDYFQLDVNMSALYRKWIENEKLYYSQSLNCNNEDKLEQDKAITSPQQQQQYNFEKKFTAINLQGLRILKIDPFECLLSFICSSNNGIPRITQMVSKLSIGFGIGLGYVKDNYHLSMCAESDDDRDVLLELANFFEQKIFFAFPQSAEFCQPLNQVEAALRDLGFGYRAKYIVNTCQSLLQLCQTHRLELSQLLLEYYCPSDKNLYQESYERTKSFLVDNFQGVGPKVADCVMLFSLGFYDAVPVDTHVLQIAQRDYRYPKIKSVTPTHYLGIQQLFKSVFGDYCGWAHSVLFVANLKWNHLSINQNGYQLQQGTKRLADGQSSEQAVDSKSADTIADSKVKQEEDSYKRSRVQLSCSDEIDLKQQRDYGINDVAQLQENKASLVNSSE